MRPADLAWAEALSRFEEVVDPETGLDADQVSQFRHRLLGLLDETVDRIAAINAVRRDRGEGTSPAVEALLSDRVAAHGADVEAIGAALVAIDQGTFGICLRCHRPIGAEVLEQRPYERCCPRCAASGPGVDGRSPEVVR